MTLRPIALSIALSLVAAGGLSGCDNTASLTEQEHIQRAKDFEDQGKLNVSIIELKNAIQKNPDSPQARLLLGQVYLKIGSGAAAEKELSRAEQLGVNRETINPQLGEALLLMGEYKRVLDEIQPSEKTSTINLARIYQIRADAMIRQGQVKDACNLYQQSLNTDKSNPPTYWGLAQCAVAEQNQAQARAWLDDALKLDNRQAQTWIAIGNLEQLNKNLSESLSAYSNALKSEPNNPEALQSRAALNIAMGQLDAAKTDIDAIGTFAPQSLAAYYLQALLSFEQKKYPEARSALNEVFKLTPDHMPSVLLAGATAHALGSHQQAESQLNRFLARFPHHAYARRVLASTQIKQSQPDRALETLMPLVTPEARDAAALVLASEAYQLKGESAKTVSFLERAVAIDPKNVFIQTQLGINHLASGDRQLAMAELRQAASLDSSQHRASFVLLMAHLDRKEYDKALKVIDGLEKGLENSPITHTMRGSALLGKNDESNARKSFEKALSIDPAFFPAAASLAELDLRDKQPDMARKRFERVLDKDKTHLHAMLALAQWAKLNKQEKTYLEWLDKAASAHPNAIEPQAARIRALLDGNEPQKAMVLANSFANTHPDNPVALDLLGNTQMRIKDFPGALNTFTKLVRIAPQSADAHLRLALAQIAAKKFNEAQATLQVVLKLSPNRLQAQDALFRLAIQNNKPNEAAKIAHNIQTFHPNSPLGFEREGDLQILQKYPDRAAAAYERALITSLSSTVFIKLHNALAQSNSSKADLKLQQWLSQHPKDNSVRLYAADYYSTTGRHAEAIALYQALLNQSPRSALLLNNLASVYHQAGDKRALVTAEQAFKLAPTSPAILDTYGWILVEQGQTSRGLDILREALTKMPRNPDIRFHLAAALARSGDKARARVILEQLLKEISGSPQAAQAQKLLSSL